MRRTCLAVLLLAVKFSPASAQPTETKPELPGGTRIAVVNIGFVFNNYDRAKKFKQELEQAFLPFKTKAKKLQDEINSWETGLQIGKLNDAEGTRAAINRNRKELEDLSAEMQKQLGKRQEDNLVALWKEVQAGIKTYATDNKIDLVLGYGDPLDPTLMDLFPNINRKMQAMDSGSATPLFVSPRTEIAPAVTNLLNTRLREKVKADKVVDPE